MTRGAKPGNHQLFNHEICELLDMRGHIQAQGLSSLEIYNEFKLCRGLNGEIAWFFTFQNAIRVSRRKSKLLFSVSFLRHSQVSELPITQSRLQADSPSPTRAFARSPPPTRAFNNLQVTTHN